MKDTRDWDQIEEADKLAAAMHEAGHYVVAIYFKLKCKCFIKRDGNASRFDKAYIGQTHYHPTTKLRETSIGWAGLIAEEIHKRECRREQIPFEPDRDFYEFTIEMIDELSETDQLALKGHSWRAFAIAWKIVLKNRNRIKLVADIISREPGVVFSEDLPAPNS